MKNALCLLLILSLPFGLSACTSETIMPESSDAPETSFVQTDDGLTLTRNGLTVTVDPENGLVTGISSQTDSLSMDGIFIDAGIAEASVFNQLGYKDMDCLATYELPTLYPRMKAKTA